MMMVMMMMMMMVMMMMMMMMMIQMILFGQLGLWVPFSGVRDVPRVWFAV
jgi:hypothetical protein